MSLTFLRPSLLAALGKSLRAHSPGALSLCMVLSLSLVIFGNPDAHADIAQPLDPLEQTLAIELARYSVATGSSNTNERLRSAQQTPKTAISGALDNPHLLSVELKEQKPRPGIELARLAVVFLYDYVSQQTIYRVIDLETEQIVEALTLEQHHLPLTQQEIDYAIVLLQQNADAMGQIRAEYLHLTNNSMTDIAQIDIKVSIHNPHSSLQGSSRVCQQMRCAEFSLFTHDLVSLTTEPVISLTTGSVLGLQIN